MIEEDTDNPPGDGPEREKLDDGASRADAGQEKSAELAHSSNPLDQSSRELVRVEESLWGRLARLKDSGRSLETRQALRHTYTTPASSRLRQPRHEPRHWLHFYL